MVFANQELQDRSLQARDLRAPFRRMAFEAIERA